MSVESRSLGFLDCLLFDFTHFTVPRGKWKRKTFLKSEMEKKCLVLQYLSRYSRETCNTLNSLENKEFQFLELVDAIHRELELEKKKKKSCSFLIQNVVVGNDNKKGKRKLFVYNWRLFVEFLVVQSFAVEKYRLNIFPVNPWGCLFKVRERISI